MSMYRRAAAVVEAAHAVVVATVVTVTLQANRNFFAKKNDKNQNEILIYHFIRFRVSRCDATRRPPTFDRTTACRRSGDATRPLASRAAPRRSRASLKREF